MRCALCICCIIVTLAVFATSHPTKSNGKGDNKGRWGNMNEQFEKKLKKRERSEPHSEFENSITEVNNNAGVAEHLFEGDIVLSKAQIDDLFPESASQTGSAAKTMDGERTKRQAMVNNRYPTNLWGTTFYYEVDPAIQEIYKVQLRIAIALWENNTCIDFVESNTAVDRVRFINGDGCFSALGKAGGVQHLSLGDGCEGVGMSSHEIGHALGFFHEQSRHDRDTAVTVMLENITPGREGNFAKQTTSTNYNYNMPYEYGSIMHYSPGIFSTSSQPTIIAKVSAYQPSLGSSVISFYDYSMMNEYYQCKAKCPTGATCVNGGFRHPRNCSTCLCPSGWGGPTCCQRPAGCGATLTACSTSQNATIVVGDGGSKKDTYFTCNYHIKAPVGYKVELTISTIQTANCGGGCGLSGLEVKAMSDHRYTGIKYCCLKQAGTKIVSEGNMMPIIAFSRKWKQEYTVNYRYVAASTPSTVVTSQIPFTAPTY